MIEIIASVLILFGAILHFTAALGLLKFPGFLLRLHAASKSSTFGVGLILFGFAMLIGNTQVWLKFLLVAVFIFLSAPVVAHLFARVYIIKRTEYEAMAKWNKKKKRK